MGEVRQFPQSRSGSRTSTARVHADAIQHFVFGERCNLEWQIAQIMRMQSSPQQGEKTSRSQPGVPTVHFDDNGLRLSWWKPYGRGQQVLEIHVSKDDVRLLCDLLGRLPAISNMDQKASRLPATSRDA